MRISEFSRAASVYQKRSVVACIAPLSIALLLIIAYAPLQHRLESFLSTRINAFAVDLLAALPMALPTVLAFLFIIPLARRIDRQSGIACPHCAKTLANHKAIVIASRNCPYCGKKVIEDES
jgi:DNA-directed RNA polymerase subunit RPC12/RpoP